ncbi:MAG: universal stress protein [Bdellovibrionota bacterium]
MKATGLSENGSVIVAVCFDNQTEKLVDAAVQICRLTKQDLCMVNVLVPSSTVIWNGEIYGGITADDLLQANDSMLRESSEAQLLELSTRIPDDVNWRVSAMVGDPVSMILAESKKYSGKMIVSGSGKGKHWLIPKSMSTVLSLMAEAHVPVLVINEQAELELPEGGQGFKILIMDDLSDASKHAIEGVFASLAEFAGSQVCHTHVSGLTKDALGAAIVSASAAVRSGVVSDLEKDDVFKAIEEKGLERLRDRVGPGFRDIFNEKNGRYLPKMLYGNVSEALKAVIEEFDPHVICFGKHSSFHKGRPFAIGQVAYGTMLGQSKPILVMGA